MKKLSSKNKYKDNPRIITEKEQKLLKKHLKEFGDLSGIVYCVNNKAFVGGNQRSDALDGLEINIRERFEKPTKSKTVAYGDIVGKNGELYAYREVKFTKQQFKKACIVANSNGGAFDWAKLTTDVWNKENLKGWGVNFPAGFENFGKKQKKKVEFEANSKGEKLFFLNIQCDDENQCKELYNQFIEKGFNCKIVT